MERLTYDFCIGGNHCWQVKGADNLECREVCERQGDDGCKTCPIAKAFDRLAAYEDTGLEPEEIISATDMAKIACALHELNAYKELGPIDRLRELAQADQVGHCIVFDLHYPVVSEYYKDEDGLFIREASGVISKEEYEAALRREQK